MTSSVVRGDADALEPSPLASARPRTAKAWLLEGLRDNTGAHSGPHSSTEKTHSWWRVMCLTGVDYFSTHVG